MKLTMTFISFFRNSGLIGLTIGLILGFSINEILRNNQLLSNRNNKVLETGHRHRRRHSPALQTVIADRSKPPTVRLLQEKEKLLDKKLLEYEKLRYENFNKEEELKLEINHLEDFIEKLKLFIQQEESKDAILTNGSKENTLAMMNILLYSPDQSLSSAQDMDKVETVEANFEDAEALRFN
jgi:hypothetical protein